MFQDMLDFSIQLKVSFRARHWVPVQRRRRYCQKSYNNDSQMGWRESCLEETRKFGQQTLNIILYIMLFYFMFKTVKQCSTVELLIC